MDIFKGLTTISNWYVPKNKTNYNVPCAQLGFIVLCPSPNIALYFGHILLYNIDLIVYMQFHSFVL